LLAITPLRAEARAVRSGAPHAHVEQIGMGPERAAAAARRLLPLLEAAKTDHASPMVAVLGCAGALVGDLSVGDVVVAEEVRREAGNGAGEDADSVPVRDAGELAEALREAGLSVRNGPVVSADRIVRGREQRAALGASGALAVDMESWWLGPLAGAAPFAVVRVILDTPEWELVSARFPVAVARTYRTLKRAARVVSAAAAARGLEPTEQAEESGG
jgi:4-hydroxy-3-methylbut-2-enyl diphosphate reductase